MAEIHCQLHGVRFTTPDERIAVAERAADLAVARSLVVSAASYTPRRSASYGPTTRAGSGARATRSPRRPHSWRPRPDCSMPAGGPADQRAPLPRSPLSPRRTWSAVATGSQRHDAQDRAQTYIGSQVGLAPGHGTDAPRCSRRIDATGSKDRQHLDRRVDLLRHVGDHLAVTALRPALNAQHRDPSSTGILDEFVQRRP